MHSCVLCQLPVLKATPRLSSRKKRFQGSLGNVGKSASSWFPYLPLLQETLHPQEFPACVHGTSQDMQHLYVRTTKTPFRWATTQFTASSILNWGKKKKKRHAKPNNYVLRVTCTSEKTQLYCVNVASLCPLASG